MLVCTYVHVAFSIHRSPTKNCCWPLPAAAAWRRSMLPPLCCCCCCCCAPPACSYRRSLCLAARQPLLSVLESAGSSSQHTVLPRSMIWIRARLCWRYPLWNTVLFTTIAEGVQFSHPRGLLCIFKLCTTIRGAKSKVVVCCKLC
jgi:hypothetical protein